MVAGMIEFNTLIQPLNPTGNGQWDVELAYAQAGGWQIIDIGYVDGPLRRIVTLRREDKSELLSVDSRIVTRMEDNLPAARTSLDERTLAGYEYALGIARDEQAVKA